MQMPELKFIKQIGPNRAEALNLSGIHNILDLLTYFPYSYIDRTATISVKEIHENIFTGLSNEESLFRFGKQKEVIIIGKIIRAELREFRPRKKMLILTISDTIGYNFEVFFFQYAESYYKSYSIGKLVAISGVPSSNKHKKISFVHPETTIIEEDEINFYTSGGIIPKYKITDKMRNYKINNRILRQIIHNAIELHLNNIQETLPEYLLKKYNFPSLKESIKNLHFPTSRQLIDESMHRMKFEELFYYQLAVRLQRQKNTLKENGIIVKNKSISARKLYNKLPFKLSADQKKVLNEFAADFSSGKPMNRLLQGDVGSGKTVVSVLTMLMLVDAGYQVVMMAPTELLAEQHFHSISKFIEKINSVETTENLEKNHISNSININTKASTTNANINNSNINIIQLVGGLQKKNKEEIVENIASGKSNIIVGTHALFQKDIKYCNLGLVVIDEQHRFGVMQRGELIKLAKESMLDTALSPHILYMTATPIPRTLTMTLYADLDVSIIKTMPINRVPIQTKVTFEGQRADIYSFISREVASGRQAYIVFPLVEKSEKIELKSAVEHYELIQEEVFPNLRCGLIHGQMSWQEKEKVMKKFLNKEYDVLVATTVIEVGIDVPNATVMLIENAERFGLTQLHQLRGRIGRSDLQSYCFLMTKDNFKFHIGHKKNTENEKIAAIVRLRTMQDISDGFKIAEVDMNLRGPGDIMGTKQAGLPDFKYSDIINDVEILSQAAFASNQIINTDENLSQAENLIIRENLQNKYKNTLLSIA